MPNREPQELAINTALENRDAGGLVVPAATGQGFSGPTSPTQDPICTIGGPYPPSMTLSTELYRLHNGYLSFPTAKYTRGSAKMKTGA